jgi:Leucine-rich repeat (LRR) protein
VNEIQSLLGQEIPAVSSTSLRDEGRPLGYLVDSGEIRGLAIRNLGLGSLPESVGTFDRLRVLLLNGNALTLLPSSIGNLTELEELDLDENQLPSLPGTIGRLTGLRRLSLFGSRCRMRYATCRACATWSSGTTG